ncbi:DNA cytosine methyltransferase [Flexivirga sp. B27]
MKVEITVVDLFSGAGGLTAGFHSADPRFRTIAAVEHDLSAAATFAANTPEADVHCGDITAWVDAGSVPTADVVVGGPPCQGFSALGKRDVNDERNQLWEQYARVLLLARPKYFVVENVAAFLRSPQFSEFRERIDHGDLSDWSVKFDVLNSADYGAAQERKRAVMIGYRRDMPAPEWPEITHDKAHRVDVKSRLLGLSEVVRRQLLPDRFIEFEGRKLPGVFTTDELHLTRTYELISLKRFAYIPEGGNRRDIPDELLTPCWRSHQTGASDVMGRLHWNKPSVTIRTEFFKPEKGRFLHPTEPRAITHQEAARLQGFPDDYKWVGNKTSIARQIGNAVPLELGAAIGAVIGSALE